MISVEELKKAYPSPTTPGCSRDGYCVGGALCRSLGIDSNFPGSTRLGNAIIKATGRDLESLMYYLRDGAYDRADIIIGLNDAGKFDEAWDALEKALAWATELRT